MNKGMIFNIQRFCLNDGPGVRTTVFFKGCPLRCVWCHNPEAYQMQPQLLFDAHACIDCGACEAVCSAGLRQGRGRSECKLCGRCAEICPSDALELVGRTMRVEEVMEQILRDRPFYDESGGGITLSGGEPLLQASFAAALLKEAKRAGLHTCVETCGHVAAEDLKKAAAYTDLFLYDWKLTDKHLHRQYTGADNERIVSNLRLLDRMNKKIVLRCPVIPGINDTISHFRGIASIAQSCANVLYIELEPYHAFGEAKSKRMGKEAETFRVPAVSEAAAWKAEIEQYTNTEIKIG